MACASRHPTGHEFATSRARFLCFGLLVLLAGVTWSWPTGDSPPPTGAHIGRDPCPEREPALIEYEASLAKSMPFERVLVEVAPGETAPSPEGADDEWRAFPITTFSFPSALVGSPARLDVRWLFRNRQLNPRDRYLSPASRDRLRRSLAEKKPVIIQRAAAIADTSALELTELITRGAASSVNYADYVFHLAPDARQDHERRVAALEQELRRAGDAEGLTPEAVAAQVRAIRHFDPRLAHGFPPFAWRCIGDCSYACRLEDMARTRVAVTEHGEAVMVCVADVGRILREVGALDGAESDSLVAAASSAVDDSCSPIAGRAK